MADDRALVDLVRRVLRLDATKHQRRDAWTTRYTARGQGGKPGSVERIGQTTARLRQRVLDEARESVGFQKARHDRSVEARHLMNKRFEEERKNQELCERETSDKLDEARRLLAEARVALGADESEAAQ